MASNSLTRRFKRQANVNIALVRVNAMTFPDLLTRLAVATFLLRSPDFYSKGADGSLCVLVGWLYMLIDNRHDVSSQFRYLMNNVTGVLDRMSVMSTLLLRFYRDWPSYCYVVVELFYLATLTRRSMTPHTHTQLGRCLLASAIASVLIPVYQSRNACARRRSRSSDMASSARTPSPSKDGQPFKKTKY